ncbi:MAG: preprotein translocase subunit SecG [Lachnospiraceae bacterium]|nr:preprotein translocase subunit SecG [Lachnospiraceae bacterium]
MVRTVLTVIFFIVCVALCILILAQKGRDSGIGGLTGSSSSSDTYWAKNKGRSREGMMILWTRILAIAAVILVAVLNISRF